MDVNTRHNFMGYLFMFSPLLFLGVVIGCVLVGTGLKGLGRGARGLGRV